MDKKRKFRIEGGSIGGELVIGTVSVDFVKYWQEREGDLVAVSYTHLTLPTIYSV